MVRPEASLAPPSHAELVELVEQTAAKHAALARELDALADVTRKVVALQV